MSTSINSFVNNFSIIGAVIFVVCIIGSSPISGPHQAAVEVNSWRLMDRPQPKPNGTVVPVKRRIESVPVKQMPKRPLTKFDIQGLV